MQEYGTAVCNNFKEDRCDHKVYSSDFECILGGKSRRCSQTNVSDDEGYEI